MSATRIYKIENTRSVHFRARERALARVVTNKETRREISRPHKNTKLFYFTAMIAGKKEVCSVAWTDEPYASD